MKCENAPGRLRHRILLQTLERTEDGQGGFTEEWTDSAYLWAEITPLKGWELMRAQQLDTAVTHKVLMRYRRGLSTEQRFIYRGRAFRIKEAINLEERKRFHQLMCIESGPEWAWENANENWEDMNSTWEATP